MTEEVKRLLKQINGKEVVYTGNKQFPDARINCVLLADPSQRVMSVKPIDSPEEVFDKIFASANRKMSNNAWIKLQDTIREPDFCVATMPFNQERSEAIFRVVASIPEKGEYVFSEILLNAKAENHSDFFGNPSCPY
jgi:hypothetical protein